MANRQGQQIDNYRLIRLLGAGGFGEVYLAEHVYRRNQDPVAIKVLSQLAQDDLQSFLTEARNFRLRHRNIVQILDFGVERRIPFIVMEYAPNGTLRQRHPKGTRVPLSAIVSYVKDIANALQYAYDEQRLIHRDIKPENMLIGEQDEILLSDFGIATIARSTLSQSEKMIAGTIPYMAPEQINSNPHPASDQYSLAVVVYEWLCGERPFHGTFTEIAMKHTMTPPPPLCEKRLAIPADVERIVMTALAKDPSQRFESVVAFAHELEQASLNLLEPMTWPAQPEQMEQASINLLEPMTWPAQSEQMEQASINLLEPMTWPAQSEQVEQASINLLEPMTLPAQPEQMAVPASSPPPSQSPTSKTDTTQEQEHQESLQDRAPQSPTSEIDITDKPTQPWISRRALVIGLGAGLAVATGGLSYLAISRIPCLSPLEPNQTSTPVSSPIPIGTTLFTYSRHLVFVNAVAWSPDGKRIASGSDDGTVQVWDATDGGNVYTYKGHSWLVVSVAWSPDGKRIASGSRDKTVQVWDATNGDNPFTYRGHNDFVDAVAWSPDSKWIVSGSYDGTVQVWDASNGNLLLTYRGHSKNAVYAVAWSPDGKRIASGSHDNTVQVWNAANGDHIYTYKGHSWLVVSVAWSPDSKRIASASSDKTVQVWDAADGSHVFTSHKHSDVVLAVTWSHNGKRIASGAGDHTVRVWDAADGSHTFTYEKHSKDVRTVAWSPDDKRIASGGDDNTVQVWQAR
jgi:WD40 repeat protein